eukprot:TRINITY_DN2804_c0_g1_i3.p1 TRINITY_DN2804_c0_g1~~TRINITY_DN2804_c0_g1_i3.p1  ORF type:complete len:322 (+),score=59.68 TRINITY_DN2804_c0_g1_i3:142-1107(+)
MLTERERCRRMAHFDRAATVIQSLWRGYRSRLCDDSTLYHNNDGLINNYYLRKKRLQELLEKGKQASERGNELLLQQKRELEEEKAKQLEQAERERKSKKHHLVGTKNIPSSLDDTEESQIISVAKQQIKSSPRKEKDGFLPPISTKMIPTDIVSSINRQRPQSQTLNLTGPFPPPHKVEYFKQQSDSNITIRRAEPYGYEDEVKRAEKEQNRAFWVGKRDFTVAGKPLRDVPYSASVHQGTAYQQEQFLYTAEGIYVKRTHDDKEKQLVETPFIAHAHPTQTFDELAKKVDLIRFAAEKLDCDTKLSLSLPLYERTKEKK